MGLEDTVEETPLYFHKNNPEMGVGMAVAAVYGVLSLSVQSFDTTLSLFPYACFVVRSGKIGHDVLKGIMEYVYDYAQSKIK